MLFQEGSLYSVCEEINKKGLSNVMTGWFSTPQNIVDRWEIGTPME